MGERTVIPQQAITRLCLGTVSAVSQSQHCHERVTVRTDALLYVFCNVIVGGEFYPLIGTSRLEVNKLVTIIQLMLYYL